MKKEFMNTITRKLGKTKLSIKKASPEILIVAGTVGVVVSAVMACKATLKVESVVDDTKEKVQKINEAVERGETEAGLTYSPEDKQHDLTILYAQTAVSLAKLYGPAVLMGAASIGCIIGSHNILRKRNVALAAAYATVDKAYKEYRDRVIEKFGEEVDRQLRFDTSKQTVTETVKDENGEEKTVEKEVDVVDDVITSPYSKFFDESSRCWEKDANYNLMFLRRMQSMFNDKLKANGYVFLNDVYDALDIERTPEGQTVGWVYDPENPELKNYIDFGIYDVHRKSSRDFVNGLERVILLNFNVDGNILQSFKSYEVK
jgi:hypothetical protein